jgi:hypothetical protein
MFDAQAQQIFIDPIGAMTLISNKCEWSGNAFAI